ncbi:MAG: hypothetical protein FJX67_07830 [Alphaproteobacteria bacterium]|nr:hypothetical protein [Alphaproteobacteria bacterium]
MIHPMIHRSRRSVVLALLATGLAVSGCAQPPPVFRFDPPSFAARGPIRLDVARIEVVRDYVAPAAKPHVDHLFRVTPAAAAERWADDRLRAAGTAGTARAIVRTASVVEVPLPRTGGLRGAFTTDQTERYDAVLEMRIEVVGGRGARRGLVAARAERSRTVAEDITLQGRERVWHEMTEALMTDLDASLERQIREHLGDMLR